MTIPPQRAARNVCTYLDTKIVDSGSYEREVADRVVIAKKVIGALNTMLWPNDVHKEESYIQI